MPYATQKNDHIILSVVLQCSQSGETLVFPVEKNKKKQSTTRFRTGRIAPKITADELFISWHEKNNIPHNTYTPSIIPYRV